MTCSPSARCVAAFNATSVLCFVLSMEVASAAVDASITVASEWAYAREERQTEKFETLVKPEFEVDFGTHSRLTVVGRVRGDTRKRIDVDDSRDAELRELYIETYIETSVGRAFFTLGKQQIVWGKADGLKVLDVVNPQNWREFILDDFDESRIPLWSANVEIPMNDLTLQLLWLPDPTYNEFADDGDRYAFTSPQLRPLPPAGVAIVMQAEERPKRTLESSDWGMRLSTFWQGWDLTLNYLYHYSDTPVLFRQLDTAPTGALATITPRYERSQLMGGTFSNAFGDLTLRGEVGYTLDRYVSTRAVADSNGVVKTNELAYVVGLDWFGVSDTLLSVQLFQSRLKEHKAGMVRAGVETTMTLLVRRDFMNETLFGELLWLHNIDFDDGLARPKVTYQMSDEVTLWLGVDLFYGDQRGLFGQFKKRDRIVAAIEVAL